MRNENLDSIKAQSRKGKISLVRGKCLIDNKFTLDIKGREILSECGIMISQSLFAVRAIIEKMSNPPVTFFYPLC
jgi:hypothetical protein